MTTQFRILTETLAMGNPGHDLDINPFYGSTKNEVMNNFDYAKQCYDKIFKGFVNAYCILKAKEIGIIDNTDSNSLIADNCKNGHKIIKGIEEHIIPPMPGYNELRELNIDD